MSSAKSLAINPRVRYFSTATKTQSIFESADFLQDEEAAQTVESSNTRALEWLDGNDAMNGLNSTTLKDMANLPTGQSTYGFYEYVVYLDDIIYSSWV